MLCGDSHHHITPRNSEEHQMKRYVVGFVFSPDRSQVLLIQKARPEWQMGKLNGVGGHVEKGEMVREAMIRECQEESGILIENWIHVVQLFGSDFHIDFFYSTLLIMPITVKNPDATEPVAWYPVETLSVLKTLPNLQWLIPLCLDESILFPTTIRDVR